MCCFKTDGKNLSKNAYYWGHTLTNQQKKSKTSTKNNERNKKQKNINKYVSKFNKNVPL